MIYDFDELNFQILSVIRVEQPEGVFDVNGRPYAALSFRVSGRGDFIIDGEEISSETGDLLFMPAGASYKVHYSGGEMLVLHFFDCNYSTPESIPLENVDYVKRKFSEMLDSWHQKHSPNEIKSITYKVLQSITDSKAAAASGDVLSKMIEYMNERYSDPDFDISELCRKFYTSSATVRRRFSEGLHTSPKQYLMKIRLDNAIDLLAEGNYSVRTVSLMCGFADEKYFSRIFREKYGRAPSEINKKLIV
ncbi:MAG: helix-turn-helix transcriptional regulator [Clostridia bacterium]|nr:helix-turn-helix transcriptional regulator [Clostridia bacterium]